MNTLSNKGLQFLQIYNRNLKAEIDKNIELKRSLEEFTNKFNMIYMKISNSIPLVIARKVIVQPLQISDFLLCNIYKGCERKASKLQLEQRLENFFANNFGFIRNRLVEKINIPQFYGGNPLYKHFVNDKIEKKISDKRLIDKIFKNRDEKSISYIENRLIPNIFIRHEFLENDKRIKSIVNAFHDYIREICGIKEYNFHHFMCIDLRNLETDGYNADEEIDFTFEMLYKIKYIKEIVIEKIFYFDCNIKFDKDDRVISFSYNEK